MYVHGHQIIVLIDKLYAVYPFERSVVRPRGGDRVSHCVDNVDTMGIFSLKQVNAYHMHLGIKFRRDSGISIIRVLSFS